MTAAEAKTIADNLQPSLKQAEVDMIMALISEQANLGKYKLEYTGAFEYENATIKKLTDPPNSYTAKDLRSNEGFYLFKW